MDGCKQITGRCRRGCHRRCRCRIARRHGGRGILRLRKRRLRRFRRQRCRCRRRDPEQHPARSGIRHRRRNTARSRWRRTCRCLLHGGRLLRRNRRNRHELRRCGIGRRRQRHAPCPRLLRLCLLQLRGRQLPCTRGDGCRQQHRRQQPARTDAACVHRDCALACRLGHQDNRPLRRRAQCRASLATASRATICRRSYAVGMALAA